MLNEGSDSGARHPLRALAHALLVAALALAGALWGALEQPWTGLALTPDPGSTTLRITHVFTGGPAEGRLAPGDRIAAIGSETTGMVPLEAIDLLPDPDLLPDFAALNRFMARQDRLHAALASARLRLLTDDGRLVLLTPHDPRPVHALPLRFWLLNGYGMLGLLIGTWVWVASGHRDAGLALLGSSLGYLLLCACVSVIVTRELALPAPAFRAWLGGYHLGNNLFSLFLLMLLSRYPNRLRLGPLPWLFIAWVAFAWCNERFQWTDLPFHNTVFQVAVLFASGTALFLLQWRRARGRPAERAVLKLLALAILSINALAVGFYYFASLRHPGTTALPLTTALALILGIYLALALGVLRVRLFDVDRWWFHLWLWLAAGGAILALDAFISLMLPRADRHATLVALALVGWLYFPLRTWLWKKVFPDPDAALPQALPGFVLGLVTHPRHASREEWRRLLRELFRPLDTEETAYRGDHAQLLEAGEHLYIPDPGGRSGCILHLAGRGRRLFDRRDSELADTLLALTRKVGTELEAYRQGERAERERIMRDLHDDVGGRLLTLIHLCEGTETAVVARDALEALREIIHFSMDASETVTIERAAAHWRFRLHERLARHGVRLEWDWPDPDTQAVIPARHALELGRILQEAVSNALDHAAPACIRIHGQAREHQLRLIIVNDGAETESTMPPLETHGGHGLENMRRRIEGMNGRIAFFRQKKTFRVELEMPLERKPDHA